MAKKRRVLTVDRGKWLCGSLRESVFGISRLRNDAGMMCCLGFDAIACGVPADRIRGAFRPGDLETKGLPESYVASRVNTKGQRHPVELAIAANDARAISQQERERRVRKHLMKLGWDDVRFVGKPPSDDVVAAPSVTSNG
jgi:hypothetical protein